MLVDVAGVPVGVEVQALSSANKQVAVVAWRLKPMGTCYRCYFGGMRIYLGADHAGFETKNVIARHLEAKGHEVIDCGAHEYDALDDYPAFCIDAAQRVVADPGSLGIVLGGSGNGEQIAANKVKGARCALAWSTETAKLAREHNNAQLIGIGGRMHSEEEALAIVDAFIEQPWSEEERHQRRIDILSEYERTGVAPEK